MGQMFLVPIGMMPEEKAHRLAFANQKRVIEDAYGGRFPHRDAFAKLPQPMQREAALLAWEAGAPVAFFEATGLHARHVINQRCSGKIMAACHDGGDNERQAEGMDLKIESLLIEVAALVERMTVPAPGTFVASVDIYRRAVALGVAPDCGERFFSHVLQKGHKTAERQISGKNQRLVCLLDRVLS